MIDPLLPVREEPCYCGDRRKFHDPCSVCECPFFRPASRVKAKKFKTRPAPPEVDDGTAD